MENTRTPLKQSPREYPEIEYPEKELTHQIIGRAIEVHRNLGPGLLESIYRECLAFELQQAGIPFQKEAELPVIYKGSKLPVNYRMDLFVDGKVIVEIKSVGTMNPVFEAQLMTYLKLTSCHVGLLMNFNVPVLKDGIKRIVY